MQPANGTPKLIVVTGGAGFVGSRLVHALVGLGHRVISLDNYFTGARENHVPGAEYREGHTRDIEKHIPETPDLIYHLGEYSRVEKSFEDPIGFIWDANIAGTFSVLEFARKRGAKIVYAGSSTKFADEGAGKSQSPYAWSKSANTELVKNYGEWYGLPYAITYFYNVYGEGEIAGGPYATLVGIFKEKYKHGHPLTVVSPGTQARNFTHIDDTVEGLLLVGAKGQGDNYGIGSSQTYSVLDVAKMFGGDILMMPERRGNRMQAPVDSAKVSELGWKQRHHLEKHIEEYKKTHAAAPKTESRVLVFSTTFAPTGAAAEKALGDVIESMPNVHFDIITTKFVPGLQDVEHPLPNVTLYRIGSGSTSDKYKLPLEGAATARKLLAEHRYIFMWSLMASYGAIAAALARRNQAKPLPLLVTLADQKLPGRFSVRRLPLRFTLRYADQVSTTSQQQEHGISRVAPQARLTLSNRSGDAFANQVRFLYNMMLKKHL
jgi:UDP-glucose 4-epimerase